MEFGSNLLLGCQVTSEFTCWGDSKHRGLTVHTLNVSERFLWGARAISALILLKKVDCLHLILFINVMYSIADTAVKP